MKPTMIKRALALVLCVTMLITSMTVAIPVSAASLEVNVQNGTGTRTAIEISGTYSYRTYMNGSFTGFAFSMPTWSTNNARATLYLYKWQGSYSATLASAPVASQTFNPLSDNAYHWVNFAAQPAGDYLFHIANISGKAGVWTNTGVSNSMGHMYLNGTEKSYQPDLRVRFADSSNASFGYCKTLTAQLPYSAAGSLTAVKMDSPMGIRVNATAPFVGMIAKLATYNATDIDADLSVYAWKGNYASTVAAEPVATQRMRLRDNAEHEIRFNELPAGEYLFLVENYTKAPGMYAYTGASNFKGYVYKDCYPWTSGTHYPLIYVVFSEERGSYYTNCSAMGDVISGTHTPPSEYVIPSDSLIYTHEVMPDTWVFTDGLGRESLTNADVGNPRSGKTLAMFYWSWHIDSFTNQVPANLQKLSEKYPESTMRDWENSLWSSLGTTTFWWNESIYGFYKSNDKWVLRKQAELLANAGVDVVFTDNTNAEHTWSNAYIPLMEEWTDAMNDGLKTPKISFMLPFQNAGSTTDESYTNLQLSSIYLNVFRSGRFHNLWFYWKGKPMVMGQQGAFMTGTAIDNEIKNFFTFRTGYPSYRGGSTNGSTWGWCSMFPQGLHKSGSTTEQITVGVAQNYDYVNGTLAAMNGTIVSGRSTYCTNPTSSTGNYSYTSKYKTQGAEASKWGYNFAQQFDYALAVDPSVIFVTGWNEFRVGRYHNWPGGTATTTENAFPDQYNDEYSRDIEPTKGALADHYYYQLVNFVRRYKGARPIPTPTTAKAIDLNGDISQWDNVGPYYAAYIDNVEDRDAAGYGNLHYTETSGRNDIIGAKIARNSQYVTFMVECKDNITPYTDSLWMNLYIDTNRNNQGWNTFEYVVNKSAASESTLVLERFTTADSYNTVKVADVEYKVDGRYMTVKIPKSALGLSGNDYTINFTWTDNVHDEGDYSKFSGDIMDFYISGDVAPGGRFKYSYISTTANTGADDPDDTTQGGGNEGGDNEGGNTEGGGTTGGEIGDVTVEYVNETISTGTRTNTPYSSITNKRIGQRYNIGDKVLKNISIINLASFDDGNVNSWSFKVWQWKGSYSATVNSTPLYSKTGRNHVNCQTMSLDIPTNLAIMGDIYYEVQYLSGSGSFTGWKASGRLPGALQTYIDGVQVIDSYASTFTVVDTTWKGETVPNSFTGTYHANVDTINGKGPGSSSAYTHVGASTLQSNGNPTGRDAVVDGITVSEDTYTVSIGGWMAVAGGIHHYAYSICGSDLITATGGKNGEPLNNYYAGSLGISNATRNGLFNGGAELTADLSAYAGKTVSVTFYAIPQADQTKAIAIMTIHNLAVPEKEEPETEPPTEPETEAPTEPETEPPTEPETEAPTEPETEPPTEPETEAPTEPETEPPTEPETEAPTESETEPPTEPETEAPTEPETEPPTEPETEPPTEPETEPPTEPETEPPTEPETEPPTEPETEPPTEPETEPPTEPETEPPTEPETEPPTEPETEPPTEPETEPPTEPETEPPTEPETEPPTEPETEPPTEPETEPPTEPETEPPTEPETEPPTEPETEPPTEPETEPPTEPETEPPTEPETEPPTEPETEPPTEPETEPPTEPETEPPTEPETEPPTEPETEPPTEPETEPPTEPETEPPTEPETEPPTEPETEPPTEPETEAPTEPETEAPTEPETEPPTEPETEPPTEPETEPPTEPETEPPTEPETEPPTEPETEPPTEPETEPPTEPETEPPTEPETEPPTEPETEPPTEPETEPPTEPETEPPTEPETEPPTEPETEPPTEPETEPPTEPETEPPTEPETEPPTEPETEPPTEPETEPPTEPETEPPTEPETEPPTEPETEPPTEPETEPPTEPETEPPTEPETEPPRYYSITVNSPKEYTVTVNGETEYYISEITESLPMGAALTLTVIDTANFAYWRDRNNKIVSRDPTLTVTVTGADEYVAVFNTKLTGKVTVIYESYYAQIIARTQLNVSGAKKWTTPATPTRYGYLCEGWSLEGDALVAAIEQALATATTDDDVIVITPIYTLPEASAEVVVVNGTGSGVYQVNNFVTIRSNAPAAGMKFAYWVDGTGKIVSYRTNYQFFLSESVTFTAVYVSEDTVINPTGITTILEVSKDVANGKLIFVSWSVIPEDYKIIKAGVIVTTDKTVGESGDGFNVDTALRVATGTTDAGQLRYTYSVKSSKVVYVRAYLVCSDANGVLHTVYGETVSASLAE